MPPSYYDLLGIAAAASTDDICRAFRREMAKYHPDKVQHLAEEFQRLAAARSAQLTQAYRTLTEPELRTRYDANLCSQPPPSPGAEPSDADERNGAVAGGRMVPADDLVKKAAMAKLRQAAHQALGMCEILPATGFELAWRPVPRQFWRTPSRWILARFVSHVDAEAIVSGWTTAERVQQDSGAHVVCVILLGTVLAPAGELARALTDRRRARMPASRRKRITVVPVDMRDWSAHLPRDAPRAVRSLVSRLQSL